MRRHYRCKVNWDLLKLLKAAMGAADVQKLKDGADKHTLFFYQLRKTSYLYKRTECGRLASFIRLADPVEGSSTKTYSKNQEFKSHLPL